MTLSDVARFADVSIATASIVLSSPDHNRFSQETRRRVMQAAEELNYFPASYARQMRGKSSHVIGLIIPSLVNQFYPEVISGFSQKANSLDYNVVLMDSNNEIGKEESFLETLIGMRASGVGLCGVYPTDKKEREIILKLQAAGIPVVRFDRYDLDPITPYVGIDNYYAGFCMTERLIQLGHQRIVVFAPCEPLFILDERVRGYAAAVQKYGLECNIIHVQQFVFGDVYQKMSLVLRKKLYTALFNVCGDIDAIECIRTASMLGANVPNDISIVGIDDIYVSKLIHPSLTTICQPKYKIGEAAMQMLDRMIKKQSLEEPSMVLPFEYVARESARPIDPQRD